MRIHTNATRDQLQAATRGLPVTFHGITEHGSRTHARAFEVRLEGTGGRNNTGHYGAGDYDGATWDEWGAFMARVFDADPTTRMGGSTRAPVYADAEDFHWQTGDRFRGLELPTDTHPRHRWVPKGRAATGTYYVAECGKCGALKRHRAYGVPWSQIAG